MNPQGEFCMNINHMKKYLLIFLAILPFFAMIGCSQSQSSSYTLAPITLQTSFFGVTLGMTEAQAKSILDSNSHLIYTPTIYSYRYNLSDGGYVWLSVRTSGLVYKIQLATSNLYSIETITYGDSLDKVKGVLGDPSSIDNASHLFESIYYYQNRNILIEINKDNNKVESIGIYDNAVL